MGIVGAGLKMKRENLCFSAKITRRGCAKSFGKRIALLMETLKQKEYEDDKSRLPTLHLTSFLTSNFQFWLLDQVKIMTNFSLFLILITKFVIIICWVSNYFAK
jgi:hypothetical protein